MSDQGGKMIYEAPEQHMCETWTARGPLGSIWRCDLCGTYWRREPVGLVRAGGWYVMSRFALWRWKRRQDRR